MAHLLSEEELNEKTNKSNEIYNSLKEKTDENVMSLVDEYVELQIEIEKHCNQ